MKTIYSIDREAQDFSYKIEIKRDSRNYLYINGNNYGSLEGYIKGSRLKTGKELAVLFNDNQQGVIYDIDLLYLSKESTQDEEKYALFLQICNHYRDNGLFYKPTQEIVTYPKQEPLFYQHIHSEHRIDCYLSPINGLHSFYIYENDTLILAGQFNHTQDYKKLCTNMLKAFYIED